MLAGGLLFGVEIGDEYLIMKPGESEPDPDRALAEARVTYADSTTAFIDVTYRDGEDKAIPPGSHGFPVRSHARRGAVEVTGAGDVADKLRARIDADGHLRLLQEGDDTPPMARVALDGGTIDIRDSDGQSWIHPVAFDTTVEDERLVKVVQNLKAMGRAEALRRLQSGDGPFALDGTLRIEWGTVKDGEATTLDPTGARLSPGDRIHLEVTNEGPGTVYVSIFDIGLTGKITLLSLSGSTGLKIPAGKHDGVGLHPHLGVIGHGPLSWSDLAGNGEVAALLLAVAVLVEVFDVLEVRLRLREHLVVGVERVELAPGVRPRSLLRASFLLGPPETACPLRP